MSSIFFTFHYDDGSNRPFDLDLAMEADTSQYQIPEVTADGLIDIFEMSADDLKEIVLTDAAYLPSFIIDFDENAEDKGLGEEENRYGEAMTILVEPSELKAWAEKWLQTLQGRVGEELEEVLPYNAMYAEEIKGSLTQIAKQAECAKAHQVGIMLFVAW